MIIVGGLIWVILMVALFCFVVKWTARLTPVHLGRVSLRAIFGAIAFTPTLIGGPMIAVPAPASMVLALGVFSPDWMGESTGGITLFAALLLGVVGAIWFFAICGGPKAETAEDRSREENEAEGRRKEGQEFGD